MKTDAQLREIENSKEFKDLINASNKFFRQKEKLQKEELKRFNKNLPLSNITEEIETAKKNMTLYFDKALNMLKS